MVSQDDDDDDDGLMDVDGNAGARLMMLMQLLRNGGRFQ